jgi:acetyl-CoA carboxylase carboxyl transferase subunit alpha
MTEPSAKPGVQDGLAFERPLNDLQTKIAELRKLNSGSHLELAGEIELLEDRLRRQTAEVYAQLSPVGARQRRAPRRPPADLGLRADDARRLRRTARRSRLRRRSRDCHRAGVRWTVCASCWSATARARRSRTASPATSVARTPRVTARPCRRCASPRRWKLPIVTFINTPGAYPGIGAEERGQASAIARNILEMFELKVPVICIVIGEGGSGGALGIGVGDRVGMLENSYYSVISPEGCAAILWKSGDKAPEAADALKLTSKDLLRLGLVDKVIEEPLGGAHRDAKGAVERVKQQILEWVRELAAVPVPELLAQRYRKFRSMGTPISG